MTCTGYMKCLGVVALTTILITLVIWSTDMYRSAMTTYLQTANLRLAQAADEEFTARICSLGNKFKTWFEPYAKDDTLAYITKAIEFKDTTIYVRINKYDPVALSKIRQFSLKYICPLNPAHVDKLFQRNMADNFLPVQASYVEYLDLEKNKIIASNAPKWGQPRYNVVSNIDTLDIMKTIGVRAYAKTPVMVILRPVMLPFITSILLIIAGLVSMFLLIRKIRHLYKKGVHILWKTSRNTEKAYKGVAERVEEIASQMQNGQRDDEATEILQKTADELQDSANQSARFWKYLSNDDGKITFNKLPTHLELTFMELKEKYEKKRHKKISVAVHYPEDLYVITDETYMFCILDELLSNSIKFSGDTVHIDLSAEMDDDELVIITVRDNGWGIPKEEVKEVFKFGYQIPEYIKRLNDDSGLGMGLAFVDSFVHGMDGAINVMSVLHQFTMFRLAWQVTPEDHEVLKRHKKMIDGIIKQYKFTPRIR